jgi:hypothetical protein
VAALIVGGYTEVGSVPVEHARTERHQVTDDEPEPFQSEILSMATANPGWHVRVRHEEFDLKTKARSIEHEDLFPVVAWAVVKRSWLNAEPSSEAESVFLDNGSLLNETEYRRRYSDLNPSPGEPKVTVHIAVEPPLAPAALDGAASG